MPKIPKRECIACSGTGKTKGGGCCVPCNGTGIKQPRQVIPK